MSAVMQQSNKIVGHKSLPLREVEVKFPNNVKARGVLDDGSSIIVMRQYLWKEIGGLPLNQAESITMECANSSVNQTMGLIRNLPMTIGGLTFYVQAQVVRQAPYKFLLGRTFSALSGCTKHDDPNGDTMISLTDPNDPTNVETMPTYPRRHGKGPPEEAFFMESIAKEDVPEGLSKLGLLAEESIGEYLPIAEMKRSQEAQNEAEVLVYKRKYKPVEKKVRAVPATLPEEFRVVRRTPRDPLLTLPEVKAREIKTLVLEKG